MMNLPQVLTDYLELYFERGYAPSCFTDKSGSWWKHKTSGVIVRFQHIDIPLLHKEGTVPGYQVAGYNSREWYRLVGSFDLTTLSEIQLAVGLIVAGNMVGA